MAKAAPPAKIRAQPGLLPYLVAPALTLVLALLVWQHFEWVNGAPYWRWAWRDLAWSRALPVTVLGLLPFANITGYLCEPHMLASVVVDAAHAELLCDDT